MLSAMPWTRICSRSTTLATASSRSTRVQSEDEQRTRDGVSACPELAIILDGNWMALAKVALFTD